jgi:hypothetical protein
MAGRNKQRATFEKRQRERARQERQAEKRARRQGRSIEPERQEPTHDGMPPTDELTGWPTA